MNEENVAKKQLELQLEKFTQENEELKQQLKMTSDREQQMAIVEKAKEAGIEAPYNEAIIEIGKKIKEKELSLDINNVQHLASLMNKSSLIP